VSCNNIQVTHELARDSDALMFSSNVMILPKYSRFVASSSCRGEDAHNQHALHSQTCMHCGGESHFVHNLQIIHGRQP